jgi:uncharacterized protein YlxW (UPF0749 family)
MPHELDASLERPATVFSIKDTEVWTLQEQVARLNVAVSSQEVAGSGVWMQLTDSRVIKADLQLVVSDL